MAYHECDCPYHYDEYGCQGPGECPNEGTIKVPGYGWLCPQCYDEIDAVLITIKQEDVNLCGDKKMMQFLRGCKVKVG
jgi:hypothetical protein